jgi:hypothetical protein
VAYPALLVVAGAVIVAGGSGWADHRRRQRRDPDRIGMIDWRTLQLAAIAVALIAISIAVNG